MMRVRPVATMMPDFFVSYNRADQSWAEWIASQVEDAGYTTTIQAWDFRPGSNFVLDMQRAATESERIIAVLSPSYLMARYTAPEWAVAFARDPTGAQGTLLPVRVRECNLEGLWPQIVYIDLVDLDEAESKAQLLAGLHRERVKPPSSAFPGAARPAGDGPHFPSTSQHQTRRQLEDSLQGAARIALGLQHRPDAVPDRQGQLVWEHARSAAAPLSARDITDAFDAFEGELLILGTPGAGKTTTLLDLAQALIKRAEQDA